VAQAGADIELRNSMLDFDFERRLIRSSMASTVERGSEFPQHPHAAQLIRRQEQLVLARAGTLNVDGGEDALIREPAVEVDFHVAGALNSSKMTSSMRLPVSISAGGDDGERAALSTWRAAAKKASRALQGVGVDTAGKHFAGRRRDGVVGASEAVMESSNTTTSRLCSTRRLAFSKTISATWMWRCGGSSKRRADHSPLTVALHVRHFFRALVNEQHDQRRLRDDWWRWHWPWTAASWSFRFARGVDQPRLALADRTKKIQSLSTIIPKSR